MVSVNVHDEQWLAGLSRAQRGTGFASVVAVRRTGRYVVEQYKIKARQIFDRPRPYTVNAFYASSRGLPGRLAVTTVGIKDRASGGGTPASRYLQAQVTGGPRRQKRSERALSGRLHGSAGFWVPGPGAKLDAYGNVPRAMIRKIIAAVQSSIDAAPTAAAARGRTSRGRGRRADRYFIPPPGSRLHPGVWKESGARRLLTPVLFFVKSVGYAKRFDFFGIGRRLVLERFPAELRLALAQGFNQPRLAGAF